MKKCQACHGRIIAKTLAVFEDDLLGIPVILLDAAVEERCEECGSVVATAIPDLDGLIAAAAVTRAMNVVKLMGDEIRFLRKAIGVSGKNLAAALEVAPETLSRWENGKDPIGPSSEKLLRMIVAGVLSTKAPAVDVDVDAIVNMRIQSVRSNIEPSRMVFERVRMKVERKKENHWDASDRMVA